MANSLMDRANRLIDWFRPVRDLSSQEVFQFRFLVGSALLGLVVATFSATVEVLTGPWLSALVIMAFGAGLLGLLISLRAGVPMRIMSWCFLVLLGLFLLSNSLLMAKFHESQLRWLVLLPMVSIVLARSSQAHGHIAPPTRAVGMAAILAIVLGVVIVVAHARGWTAGIPEPPATGFAIIIGTINDYMLYVISVTGIVWVYGNALRRTQEELLILRQMLSVCAWCKRIHDAEDGWISMERHLSKNSDAGLTHGICPDCARRELQDLGKHPDAR
jgi:hypothetical protein